MQKVKVLKYFVLFLFLTSHCYAQNTPYAEKLVTLKVINLTYKDVFNLISTQTGVVFSYAQSFNDKQKVSLIANKKPLRLVLNEILLPIESSYQFNGKYVVIKYTPEINPPKIISGYVYNSVDSSIIPKASIYLKQTKHSTYSNNYGHFSLSYSDKVPNVSVSFAKQYFRDTSIVIYKPSKKEITVYLLPKKTTLDTNIIQTNLIRDALPSKIIFDTIITLTIKEQTPFWKFFNRTNAHLKNISDTLFSKVSVSLFPPISTNHLLAINTVNKFSLNILGGYSKGVNGAELAGLFNIDNGNVKYFQAAGIVNLVSGNVNGVQLAGILNANQANTKGLQVAGVGNFNWGFTNGLQLGGIFNLTRKKVNGWQLAGIVNGSASEVKGGQLAGILNIAGSTSLQAAGIGNFSYRTVHKAQLSGIFNLADTSKFIQVAGILNASRQNNGLQVSGILNVTKNNNGVQIGLVNYADTSKGIPIGLFSFVRKGYHKIELSADELTFANIGFRTGIDKFHNILFAGVNLKNPTILTFGYGIGMNWRTNKKLVLNTDLSGQQMHQTSNQNFYYHGLYKLYFGAEYKLNNYFRMGVGPTFNVMLNEKIDPQFANSYNQIAPYSVFTNDGSAYKLSSWVGLKLSLKFL